MEVRENGCENEGMEVRERGGEDECGSKDD